MGALALRALDIPLTKFFNNLILAPLVKTNSKYLIEINFESIALI